MTALTPQTKIRRSRSAFEKGCRCRRHSRESGIIEETRRTKRRRTDDEGCETDETYGGSNCYAPRKFYLFGKSTGAAKRRGRAQWRAEKAGSRGDDDIPAHPPFNFGGLATA